MTGVGGSSRPHAWRCTPARSAATECEVCELGGRANGAEAQIVIVAPDLQSGRVTKTADAFTTDRASSGADVPLPIGGKPVGWTCQGRTAARFATCRMACSASFTAALLGKAVATSGSRTTMFEAEATLAAYLPRTRPPGKSERVYSLRSVSLVELTFLIEFPFRFGARTSTDDPDALAFVRMQKHQEIAVRRDSEREPSRLTL